jgi:adenylate cyclase
MKKKILKAVDIINSPATIGILVTAGVVTFAYKFYTSQNNLEVQDQKDNLIFNITELIDQKTMDFRFRLRGPETRNEKVAVLAIDDESLIQVGRWPWSREKIGFIIDKIKSAGAKSVGFDMVFSEPQVDNSINVLSRLENFSPMTAELQETIKTEKLNNQPDLKFAEVINKYRDSLTLGAFFEDVDNHFEPYQDLCYNVAFKRSYGSKLIETEEWPSFVFYDYYNRISKGFIFENTPFDKFLNPIFAEIEAKTTNDLLQKQFNKKSVEELNEMEQAQLALAHEGAVRKYCAEWLTEKYDPYYNKWKEVWPELFAKIPDMAKMTFDESILFLQQYMFVNPIPQKGRWTVNIPELLKASAHNAMFNAFQDSDGTIRRSPLFYRSGLNYVPSLALQTFLVSTGLQAHLSMDIDPDNGNQFKVQQIAIKDPEKDELKFTIPVDNRGRIKINYAGQQMSFPHLSASELFHDRPQIKIKHYNYDPSTKQYRIQDLMVDRNEFIKDRIFIVGATAMGVYDLRVTPFQENYPGVETHVNVLANLLSQNFLRQHPQEFRVMIGTLILTGIIFSLLLNWFTALPGALLTLVGVASINITDYFLLFKNGIIATMAFPMFQIILIYVSITFYKYLTEERKKKHLKATFSKYVSPAIVDEILKDPENIQLGGRKQRMSVFFSDVRGFTTISEKLDPQVLSSVLNEYLTPMTNIVFDNKGTLDKYMGDAVMAFFGAPIYFPDHAKHACRCAIQSIEKLKHIQVQFQQRNLPNIDIGIGVNTGDMSVGNMGSDTVRSYTVMGDAVNLGSRLEGINKEYGTRIIISEFTYDEVKDSFTAREVDWVRVKGKYKPVKIFELICEGAASNEKQQVLKLYNEGYRLYRERDFGNANILFKQAFEVDPKDPVTELYIERCAEYIQEPPPQDWDGVFIMKTK